MTDSSQDSEFGTLTPRRARVVNSDDFMRLERKVDKLIENMQLVAVLSTNHVNLDKDFSELKATVSNSRLEHYQLERKVDQWINRGIGVWAVALVLFALFQAFHKQIFPG